MTKAEGVMIIYSSILDSSTPSKLLKLLLEEGILEHYLPEVHMYNEIEQSPEFHPEGNLFNHVCIMLDAAAKDDWNCYEHDSMTVMLSILYHDIGKLTTTVMEDGKITAKRHAQAGVPTWLNISWCRDEYPSEVVDAVSNVIEHHMKMITLDSMKESTLKKFKQNQWFDLIKLVGKYDRIR